MRLIFLVLTLSLLAGCGGITLEESNPANVDFSGEWILDFSRSDVAPDLRPGREGTRRSRDQRRQQREEILGASGSGLAFVSHDFQVLRADKLSIELNHDSMGVRYTPGVYRDISWGERQRGLWEVYSGWEAGELVVISSARDLRVIERIRRQGDDLLVSVTIRADGEEREVNRVFRKAS